MRFYSQIAKLPAGITIDFYSAPGDLYEIGYYSESDLYYPYEVDIDGAPVDGSPYDVFKTEAEAIACIHSIHGVYVPEFIREEVTKALHAATNKELFWFYEWANTVTDSTNTIVCETVRNDKICAEVAKKVITERFIAYLYANTIPADETAEAEAALCARIRQTPPDKEEHPLNFNPYTLTFSDD